MKSNFLGIHEVGQFNVVSGSVEVTDPCYSPGDGVIVENVTNGEYVVFTNILDKGDWGARNAELYAINKQYFLDNKVDKEDINSLDWEPQADYFGVDSGQGGIFDTSKYPGGEEEVFYDKCCNITLEGLGAGSVDFGAVSSSGFGDGGYHFELLFDDDNEQVIGVKIIFLGDEEDDDFSDDDEDEEE